MVHIFLGLPSPSLLPLPWSTRPWSEPPRFYGQASGWWAPNNHSGLKTVTCHGFYHCLDNFYIRPWPTLLVVFTGQQVGPLIFGHLGHLGQRGSIPTSGQTSMGKTCSIIRRFNLVGFDFVNVSNSHLDQLIVQWKCFKMGLS